ncbi:MAG: PPOX class F420-dependent oxidoreductase [Candidatus Hodarchaeales archaeon]|jgi:PPOX class probable F420-dependent enzyme
MTQKMTKEEALNFLADGTKTGKLATIKKNGKPHTTPIWFVVDGNSLLFTTMNSSMKGRNLKNNPNYALTVDDQVAPYSFVIVEGKAEILNPTDEEKLKWATKIGGRYMGEKLAQQYGKRNAVPEEYLIRLHIDKTIALWNVSD